MAFLIRRLVRFDKRSASKEYQEFTIHTQRLTIGRAADQHLQIADCVVQPQHLLISIQRGQLHIKAISASSFKLNGESRRTAILSPGDLIQLGGTVITVEQSQTDFPGVLMMEETAGVGDDNLALLQKTDLSRTHLNKRLLSWVMVCSILILFLFIPLSGLFYPAAQDTLREHTLIPDDNLWLTGPLHRSHQNIGAQCDACHTMPFKMVRNKQCLKCHADIQHHVDVATQDANVFQQNRCASCHREHNEPSILVQQDQRFCADCHQKLGKQKTDTELNNATDFGTDHPEFRLTMLMSAYKEGKVQWKPVRFERNSPLASGEKSFLQFSHLDHLDPSGVKSPDGDKILACQDCHYPDSSGRQMQPIVMENHCSDCHLLEFDANQTHKKVPHGDLALLYETLTAHFSRQFLDTTVSVNTSVQRRRPGAEKRILSRDEQQRAFTWVEKQTLMIAQELLEDRLCGDCHQISKISGKTGLEQWRLEPVVLTKTWMPLARFDHASHSVEACTHCHENAEKSEKSSDILMPQIAICHECHSGGEDRSKLPSDCLMCHQFHFANRGLFDIGQRQAAEQSIAEEKQLGRLQKGQDSH